MDQYIGKMLDNRYELLEVVGVGGMAVVYKAKCHRLNRFVAVKILKPEAAADPELRRRFRDESQAVAMLSHPNIVAVYDVSKTENLEYIVMELIDGITLKQYMRQKGGPLPWKEALHFITQVMRALRHAHSRGIVHRDIKPQNIMVLRDGSCKVADFGIAHLSNSQNTMTQEALGSVHYIAPEQAKGAKVDARTDIYSAGVVLYEMLAGHLPYEGDSAVAVALQHINTTPPMPSTFNPSIPLGLEQITMKAMAMNPGDRYDSARAMLLDLDSFRKNPKVVFPYVTGQEPLTQIPKLSDEDETQLLSDNASLYGTPPTTRPERRSDYTAYTEADDSSARRSRSSGKKKKSSKAPIIIVAVVIILFLILAGMFVSRTLGGSGTGETVTIPDLVGMQYNDAVLQYGDAFDIQIGSYTQDDSQTEGAILDQDPEADSTSTASKPTITVTVCIHADSITMPDVSGMTETEALQALIAAGISSSNIIKGTSVYSSEVEEGYVAYTDPVSGTPVTSDIQVTYYLSKGTDPDAEEEEEEETDEAEEEEEEEEDAVETVTVPNFVGSTRTQVLAQLKSLGLSGTFTEVSDSSAAGTVLSQSIASGTEVEEGTTITFTVSTGPADTDDDADDDADADADADTSDTAEDSDDSTTDSSTQSSNTGSNVTVDKQITISLPTDRDEVSVSVTVGGVTAYSRSGVDTSAGSMTVTISGSGTQTVAIYIDGTLSTSYDVTFN